MMQCLLKSKWLLLSLFVLVTGGVKPLCSAQSSPASRILVCESLDDSCNRPDARLNIVWTFDGTEGSVTSPAGQPGTHLTIQKLDSASIVIRRVDGVGATSGRVALYTGVVRANHINGSVEWTWADHPGYPVKGVFSAVFQDQLQTPAELGGSIAKGNATGGPLSELLVCENGGPCNAAWHFNGSEGTGTWFNKQPTRARLTVLRLEPDYILIRRTDTTDGIAANYAGSLRGDHYSGTIIWNIPGQPAAPTGHWIATVPQTGCTNQFGLEAADAMRVGQYALMFKRNGDALDCYVVAARAGDATAQAAVGLLYYQGSEGVSQDYKEAFFWLHKAADQKVYAAERTVAEMYRAGLGTQRNSTMAAIYTERADEQKHDMERKQEFEERAQARREEHAERAADRANQLLSNFVLGASFGLFF